MEGLKGEMVEPRDGEERRQRRNVGIEGKVKRRREGEKV